MQVLRSSVMETRLMWLIMKAFPFHYETHCGRSARQMVSNQNIRCFPNKHPFPTSCYIALITLILIYALLHIQNMYSLI